MTRIGFRELRTAEAVDDAVTTLKGSQLLVINSVCGCAAGKARPGIAIALKQSPVKPDHLTTVCAGGDIEATARVRKHLESLPLSSPSIALFKDGRLVHFVPRYQIESRDGYQIAQHLIEVFKEQCTPDPASTSQQPQERTTHTGLQRATCSLRLLLQTLNISPP